MRSQTDSSGSSSGGERESEMDILVRVSGGCCGRSRRILVTHWRHALPLTAAALITFPGGLRTAVIAERRTVASRMRNGLRRRRRRRKRWPVVGKEVNRGHTQAGSSDGRLKLLCNRRCGALGASRPELGGGNGSAPRSAGSRTAHCCVVLRQPATCVHSRNALAPNLNST